MNTLPCCAWPLGAALRTSDPWVQSRLPCIRCTPQPAPTTCSSHDGSRANKCWSWSYTGHFCSPPFIRQLHGLTERGREEDWIWVSSRNFQHRHIPYPQELSTSGDQTHKTLRKWGEHNGKATTEVHKVAMGTKENSNHSTWGPAAESACYQGRLPGVVTSELCHEHTGLHEGRGLQ